MPNQSAKFDAAARFSPLLEHVLQGELFGPLLEDSGLSRRRAEWRAFFKFLTRNPPVDRGLSERFHTQWHVAGHFMRDLVQDDGVVTDALWAWLPPYEGPSMRLYRGENIDRYEAGRVGSAWSDSQETASMFARGLNSPGRGGVVLAVEARAEAIVAGPSAHSKWLGEGEHTVDWRKLGAIERL